MLRISIKHRLCGPLLLALATNAGLQPHGMDALFFNILETV